MKKLSLALGIPFIAALTSAGCIETFEDDCEVSGTCPAEGDGDASTGGTGDGDGDTGGNGGAGATGGNSGSACDPACSGSEVCDEDAGECVGCLSSDDCTDALCDTDSNTCVECLEAADCEDPALPMCNAGSCEAGCSQASDCERFGDTQSCETDSGTCVECLPLEDDRESDTDTCGTGVCDPQTLSCDDGLTQLDKDVCDSCIADAECLVGQNCIPLSYKPDGEPELALGGFCMKLSPGCAPPYQAGDINRVSLSGASATDYCGLAEGFTTCSAIEDLVDGKTCGSPTDCGTGNGEGVCDIVNSGENPQCTYSCTATNQCVTGNDCGGVEGSKYCGG